MFILHRKKRLHSFKNNTVDQSFKKSISNINAQYEITSSPYIHNVICCNNDRLNCKILCLLEKGNRPESRNYKTMLFFFFKPRAGRPHGSVQYLRAERGQSSTRSLLPSCHPSPARYSMNCLAMLSRFSFMTLNSSVVSWV